MEVVSATLPLENKLIAFKMVCTHNKSHNTGSPRKDRKRFGNFRKLDNSKDCTSIIQSLNKKGLYHIPRLQAEGFVLDDSTLVALMLYYANNGLFTQADALWHAIINSAYNLDFHLVSDLIDAYVRSGLFHEVLRIVQQVTVRHPHLEHQVYVHTISCFGKIGELELMDDTLKEMVSKGYPVDSSIGNAYMVYYSRFGSITMMEDAYKRLKSSRFLIEEDGIRAVSHAYIRDKKFHNLANFLREVGLGRKNVGNLLWNFLLLSYAANFKMKSLQREFINMVEAGFYPDLSTFNIRAVAFSKMSLFWDLHLSLEHMNYNGILPDLVTYGCVVDAYLDRRLGRNLDFALRKMNVKDSPVVLTDPMVFEVLGKGDFHSSSEALLEFNMQKTWTYKELIAIYVKKKYRTTETPLLKGLYCTMVIVKHNCTLHLAGLPSLDHSITRVKSHQSIFYTSAQSTSFKYCSSILAMWSPQHAKENENAEALLGYGQGNDCLQNSQVSNFPKQSLGFHPQIHCLVASIVLV